MELPQITITIIHGSILEVDCMAIVNAANSYGLMGGGVAGVIKRIAGSEVEAEATGQAPIPVGQAVLTSGGRTGFQGIIHAPTMEEPAMRIPARNVAMATQAALLVADQQEFRSLAFPGMGTGVGQVTHAEAAAHMIDMIRAFQPTYLQSVVLVDVDSVMVTAWNNHFLSSDHRESLM